MWRLSPTCGLQFRWQSSDSKTIRKERQSHFYTDQEGELVRVLAGRRHAHRPRPVVVEVRQLVGQLLDVLGRQAGGVLDDVVAGGVDGALPHRLGDQEEVVPEDKEVIS